MPGDRVTVQNLLDLVERNRLTTDKMSESQLETAQSMEKVAGAIASLEKKVDEKLDDKTDKRERFLFRALGVAMAVICLFAGVRVYDALEKSDKEAARESRISAPVVEEYAPPPPPP